MRTLVPLRTWATAAGLVACAPALDWREWRPADGDGIAWLAPCKPASHARLLPLAGATARMTLHACSAGDVTWGLGWADIDDPARVAPALGELQASAAANLAAGALRPLPLAVPGATPNARSGRSALDGRLPDGRPAQMQVAVFVHGTRVFQASVLGERLPADAVDTYFASMRFAP